MEIVCCYPISSSIESADDDHSCDELGEKREIHEWEDTLTIFLDYILRDEILQTFSQTEIIVDADKADQIDNGVQQAEITHTESVGEEKFDDIAWWYDQEEKYILSYRFTDQFVSEIVIGFEFHERLKLKRNIFNYVRCVILNVTKWSWRISYFIGRG